MRYALGEQRWPAILIPDAENPRNQGIVYFERALCQVARIWGEAWRGNRTDNAVLAREVRPLLRFFNRDRRETNTWSSWYLVQNAMGEFYALLVQALAQHGPAAVTALRDDIEHEWSRSDTAQYWTTDVRRQTILAFHHAGAPRAWVEENLSKLGSLPLESSVNMRVEMCQRQLTAWLELGDMDRARTQFREMFDASLSIGYEKDYQLSTWVRWLGLVNSEQPERAAERITWFARAVVTSRATTEGRAYSDAAEELLKVTFRWSPRRAVRLFAWLLDQHVIPFEAGVRALLEGALRMSRPPTELVQACLTALVLPVAHKGDDGLIAALIERHAVIRGNDRADILAQTVVTDVDVFAPPSARIAWRRGIGKAVRDTSGMLEQVGLGTDAFRFDQETQSSSDALKLDDESVLSVDEVIQRVRTIADIQSLREHESKDSHFAWERVIIYAARMMDQAAVLTVADMFGGHSHEAHILSALSERLLALGDRDCAWTLGTRALQVSSRLGWNPWYDGGSRLSALRALGAVDPKRGRDVVWATFMRDVSEQSVHVEAVAMNPETILSLLVDPIPVDEVWPLVEQHVQALFASTPLGSCKPDDLTQELPDDTADQALADLLGAQMTHPVSQIAASALRMGARRMLAGDQVMLRTVRNMLEQSEADQETALQLLDAVILDDSGMDLPFRDNIVALQGSPNFAIRHAARALAIRLGYDQPSPAHPATLPAVYELALPPESTAGIIGGGPIPSDAPQPDTSDPATILRPFDTVAKQIAQEASLSPMNLQYRAVQLMRELAPPDTWLAEGEAALRTTLEAANLHLSFQRPRVTAARLALLHIIAELCDRGMLSVEQADELSIILRLGDPGMLTVAPSRRPREITSDFARVRDEERMQEWLEQVDTEAATEYVQLSAGGKVFLAEETTFRRNDTSRQAESRWSMIAPAVMPQPRRVADPTIFFPAMVNRLVAEYPKLAMTEWPIPLIIRHIGLAYITPGAYWLALNPAIARQLGWTLADDGLFRWVDRSGNLMVESVWWADGAVSATQIYTHDETGEGWLVVATPAGFDAINNVMGPLKQISVLERRYRADEDRQLRTKIGLNQRRWE